MIRLPLKLVQDSLRDFYNTLILPAQHSVGIADAGNPEQNQGSRLPRITEMFQKLRGTYITSGRPDLLMHYFPTSQHCLS